MSKKAYKLSSPDPDQGSHVVFCNNANKAKTMCTYLFDDCRYIDARVERCKAADKYINKAVNDELGFDILVKEFDWHEML